VKVLAGKGHCGSMITAIDLSTPVERFPDFIPNTLDLENVAKNGWHFLIDIVKNLREGAPSQERGKL